MHPWIYTVDCRNAPLWVAILNALEAAIDSGQLRAGDALPSQRRLADFIGIADHTVQHAMREAARWGLVVARPQIGRVVQRRA